MISKEDTENVVSLLRPVLKDLHVQCLKFEPELVQLSNYRELIMAGMGRCVIVARRASFSDDTKGCLSFSYDKKLRIFLFIINVNENLFLDNSHEKRVERKAVAIHEFVHCASALLLSRLKTNVFIKRIVDIISKKINLTKSDEFNSLLAALKKLGKSSKITPSELLVDGHFRIDGADGFVGNYGDLYLNFLLSYRLLSETIMNIMNDNHDISLTDLLLAVHKDLVETKALQRDFVLGRIKTFLPNIVSDFLQSKNL
jgi:hypothetical protein